MKICNKTDCNNKVFSSGYCKLHQYLRKDDKWSNSLSRIKGIKTPKNPLKKNVRKATGERELFLEIWSEREHICVNCKQHLGEEPKTFYFSHIIPKRRAENLRLVKGNIELLCLECHHYYGADLDKFYKRKRSSC